MGLRISYKSLYSSSTIKIIMYKNMKAQRIKYYAMKI